MPLAFPVGGPKHLGMGKEIPKLNRSRLFGRRLLREEGWKLWRRAKRGAREAVGGVSDRKRDRESISSVGSTASSVSSESDWEEGGVSMVFHNI